MTVKDDLLKLRIGGTAITATESGATSTTRSGAKAVIEIDKCPLEGIPIEVLATIDTGSTGTGTMIVTIEASDTEASGYIVVATFPTLISTTTAYQAATRMVRRVATQKKYLRSVITVVAGTGTVSRDFVINVGVGLVDDDASY